MADGQTINPSDIFTDAEITVDKVVKDGWVAVIDGTIIGFRRERRVFGSAHLFTVAELESDETSIKRRFGSYTLNNSYPTKTNVRAFYDIRAQLMAEGH